VDWGVTKALLSMVTFAADMTEPLESETVPLMAPVVGPCASRNDREPVKTSAARDRI
jgi:hypothetical protein